ncbi:MAG: signal peptide peptidase SppA, type [Firmicutes bacterium]|nr:signal peptide peptidase SppA, type [Bacillota bacterium]
MRKKVVIIAILAIILITLAVAASWSVQGKHRYGGGQNKIAVIHVEGVIAGGNGGNSLLGESGGGDEIIRQLHKARDDSSVKAVILRINSPGGSAPASQELGAEIQKLRKDGKIVVASMGDVAASGGYWIAAVTDKIYASPATMTGSIGVYIPYANWQDLYQKIGIQKEKIKSGPHKDILSPERPMTAEERAILQGMVDDLYNQFVTVVAEGRHMDVEQVKQLADGRIYTGSQAKTAGLVDELGTMYDAIDGAAELAGIKGKPVIKEYGNASPFSMLFGASDKVNLEQLMVRHMENKLPITAPLAMPVEW